METTTTPTRYFYSACQGLGIQINAGKIFIESGEAIRLGYKHVQFSETGTGFGQLVTDDPEVIAALEKRDDVFGVEEYNKRLIPADKRADMLERQLNEANSLIAQLQKAGKIK